MKALCLSLCMLFSSIIFSQTTDIMSSPFRKDYIGFKLETTNEAHKFFLHIKGISTDYTEIWRVLREEFDYGVHLVYIASDQREKGVYVIFHNSLLFDTIVSKLRKCIQEYYRKEFSRELKDITFIGHMIDVAYGRVA